MGSIRKITREINGKTYTYYEARYTAGFDPGTGKQIQRSITDKSKKVVAQKLRAAMAELDAGNYKAPCKMTVAQWLDIWVAEYLNSVKPLTKHNYNKQVQKHFKPALGALRNQLERQQKEQEQAGKMWDNQFNLVFTDALGKYLVRRTVVKHFKKISQRAGISDDARFHDLRHSFAVSSLYAGDDIKTVQANLGHATAQFTLDVYGHVTQKMRQESANRMQKFYEQLSSENAQ